MLSKIIKFITLIPAEYFWQEAMICSSKGLKEEALKKLEKSYSFAKSKSINFLLLEAQIMISKSDFNLIAKLSKQALEKIEGSKVLNKDEKIYLSLYAVDLINLATVHGEFDGELLPRVKSLDFSNVDKRYFEYFPLLDR